MDHIKIITTGANNTQVIDSKGNVYPQHLNENLPAKTINETKVSIKQATLLRGSEFDRETIFQVTVDIIDALLDDEVDGVVLLYEEKTLDEFTFYLSLFTIMYKKPIVIFASSDGWQVFGNKSGVHDDQFERFFLNKLCTVLKIMANYNYYKFGPLIVIGNHLCSVATEHRKIAQLEQDILLTTPPQFTKKLHQVNQLIRSFPVIPEKIALITIRLGMEGKEILNIVKHYAGAVIEVGSINYMNASVKQAIKQLIKYRIPIVIVVNSDTQGLSDILAPWTIRKLPAKFARLLLGVMIAQRVSHQTMKKVCEVFR